MIDPQWVIAGLLIVGQVVTAVAVVVALRSEVSRIEYKADVAKTAASRAHGRIDTILQERRNGRT